MKHLENKTWAALYSMAEEEAEGVEDKGKGRNKGIINAKEYIKSTIRKKVKRWKRTGCDIVGDEYREGLVTIVKQVVSKIATRKLDLGENKNLFESKTINMSRLARVSTILVSWLEVWKRRLRLLYWC